MNAKSKLSVKYAEGVIEMNTTFAKMMQNPLSAEYALLQRTRQDFPTFAIRRRQIKSNPQKDTYKGLTYEWMRNHIATHEPEEVVEEKLNAFDEMVYISKCHRGSLRYPTIKKWFLKRLRKKPRARMSFPCPKFRLLMMQPEPEGGKPNVRIE